MKRLILYLIATNVCFGYAVSSGAIPTDSLVSMGLPSFQTNLLEAKDGSNHVHLEDNFDFFQLAKHLNESETFHSVKGVYFDILREIGSHQIALLGVKKNDTTGSALDLFEI